MFTNRVLTKALQFAIVAHGDQKRKYTGLPYVTHTIEVATIVAEHGGSDAQIAAALLHDTVEDTPVELQEIVNEFGMEIAELVGWLTDVSKPEDGNRAARKAVDRNHTADASSTAQFVKLADLISNTKSIVEHDVNFARVYLAEKQKLLDVMRKDVKETELFSIARLQLDAALESIQR
jgi:(p)ppGpp synthase/HD superfamily hydrolase